MGLKCCILLFCKLSILLIFISAYSQWQNNWQKITITPGEERKSWSCKQKVILFLLSVEYRERKICLFQIVLDVLLFVQEVEHILCSCPTIPWQLKKRHETERRHTSCWSSCSLMDTLSQGNNKIVENGQHWTLVQNKENLFKLLKTFWIGSS